MLNESQSTSSTPSVQTDFPFTDLLIARMIVKKLVAKGLRKGPSELLVLSDLALEEWYTEEARQFLREQVAERRAVVAEIH